MSARTRANSIKPLTIVPPASILNSRIVVFCTFSVLSGDRGVGMVRQSRAGNRWNLGHRARNRCCFLASEGPSGGRRTARTKGRLRSHLIRRCRQRRHFRQDGRFPGADVKAMIEKTVEAFGGLDCAFNNAGTEGQWVPIVEQTEEDWDTDHRHQFKRHLALPEI